MSNYWICDVQLPDRCFVILPLMVRTQRSPATCPWATSSLPTTRNSVQTFPTTAWVKPSQRACHPLSVSARSVWPELTSDNQPMESRMPSMSIIESHPKHKTSSAALSKPKSLFHHAHFGIIGSFPGSRASTYILARIDCSTG